MAPLPATTAIWLGSGRNRLLEIAQEQVGKRFQLARGGYLERYPHQISS